MILSALISVAVVQAVFRIEFTSSLLNDYNLSFDATENVLVFARSEADFQNARIFIAERDSNGWNTPVPISFSEDQHSDSDPWITPDGRTLYFISDRPDKERSKNRTDYDIWRSHRTLEGWSEPERLGPEINGLGQELGPEIHDGVLYFSSARHSGQGGLDIYQAKENSPTFEPATLLEGPFNTGASESDFTLSPNRHRAMFWRTVNDRGLIHISYRDAEGWSVPTALPQEINAGPFNFTPSFSADGNLVRYATTLYRPGQPQGHADIAEASLPDR